MDEKVRVLGIDLGTSSSAAAVLVDGKVQLVPSSEKLVKTMKPFPSVVSFYEDGGCLIGSAALEQALYNPKGTIFNVKRKMGTEERIKVFGKEYLPQFISALFLLKIKIDAEKFFDEKITKAVITVPASFNDIERQTTKEAAAIAGLDVVRLMTEPVSAAVAYGADKIKGSAKILVFDMGAGTLDVSLLEIDDGFFEVLSTSGPTTLGGINMDQEIAQWLQDEVKRQNKNASLDDFALGQIRNLAQGLKIELSDVTKVSFDEDISTAKSQLKLAGTITREMFENMISDIIAKSKDTINGVLKEAKVKPEEVDRVIPVGGPTKIPAIHAMLSQSVKTPEEGVDPDFTVASGAAIQGAIMAGDTTLPEVYQGLTLLNVTPLDLGEEAQKKGRRIISMMIPKNTPYPTEHTETFYVNKIMQTEVPISIWQGDFQYSPEFSENTNIGHFVLRGLRRGVQNEIKVTYSIDDDGILTVSGEEVGGYSQDEIVVDRVWEDDGPPAPLGFDKSTVEKIEKQYRHTMSPYEIPIEEAVRGTDENSEQYCWMCDCLYKAIEIIKAHHHELDPPFFNYAKFELSLQLDMQYAYAYIQMTGGPVYPISIHNSLKEKTDENQRILVVVLVHEILHAIHPDWGHDKIIPEERRLANLGCYYDALVYMDQIFLSGKMSFCNNSMSRADQKMRVFC